jgi:hypothetical protein
MSLPINLPKRGLSKDEAAEYCGVSENTLGRYGPTPAKIGKRTIYDRRMLDLPGHRDRPVGPYPKTHRCGRLPRCSPKPKTFDAQTRTGPRCSSRFRAGYPARNSPKAAAPPRGAAEGR